MRKPKPIGQLSTLPDEQKAALRQWFASFTYEQIQARIALPPPDGFGLNVSVWQLRRYFQRLSLDDSPTFQPEEQPSISRALDQAALGQTQFTPATIHLMEQRAFELALAGANASKIAPVMGIVFKSREAKTRERMVEIQKRKLALREMIQTEFRNPNAHLGHSSQSPAAEPPTATEPTIASKSPDFASNCKDFSK